MKAEHRHELKTNALADTLGRLMHGLKTGPSRHAVLIWSVIGVAVVVALVGYYFWRLDRSNRSELWLKVDDAERRLDDAGNAEEVEKALNDFKAIADKHPGQPQSRVLRYERARALFHRGLERLYADHDKAVDDLKEARKIYGELAGDSGGDRGDGGLLRQEAMMNVAKANESLGELEEARDGYKKLAQAYPNGVLGKAAEERANYLSDDSNRARVKQLYDKLAAEITRKPEEKPAETSGKKD